MTDTCRHDANLSSLSHPKQAFFLSFFIKVFSQQTRLMQQAVVTVSDFHSNNSTENQLNKTARLNFVGACWLYQHGSCIPAIISPPKELQSYISKEQRSVVTCWDDSMPQIFILSCVSLVCNCVLLPVGKWKMNFCYCNWVLSLPFWYLRYIFQALTGQALAIELNWMLQYDL